MNWRGWAIIGALLLLPAPAGAADSSDSISLTAPTGLPVAGSPFSFTGSGSVDGADGGNYGVQVLFWTSAPATCPADYTAADNALKSAHGGNDADNSAVGTTDPFLLESGAYTWSASVNDETVPTVTTAGSYVACAYLVDDLTNETFAVSGEVPFTVTGPKSGPAPQRFGGPKATREPSDVKLTVKPQHSPIRAPGHDLLEISGRSGAISGDGIVLTVKPTRRYNGCAPNPGEDEQIAAGSGGAVLARYDTVSANSAGGFHLTYALHFTKRVKGTAVLCAYLVSGEESQAVSVGYDRFVAAKPAARQAMARRVPTPA